jgi:MFS-type transporter involved in bile tolerance (Atg22 family)
MGSPLKCRKADGSYRVMIERWERAQSSNFQTSRMCAVSRNGACSVMDVTASNRLLRIGRAAATRFIVIGVVSLFADMAYEGARSITRPLAFAVILLGIGMAAQESVMRAVIASMTTPERRATAFGMLNAVLGFAWFPGTVFLGATYDHSVTAVAGVSLILLLLSVSLLLIVMWHGADRQVRL